MSATEILSAKGVTKRFGSWTAIKDLSLSFNRGEKALIVGANGSGKTTLLRIFAGLSRPDSGTVNCISPEQQRIGYVAHHLMLYLQLTVEENLRLFAGVAGVSDISPTLSRWDLNSHRNKRVADLSKGLQYRVSIGRALLTKPSILILDEPTSALDNVTTSELMKEVLDDAYDCVLMATHDLSRVRDIATRVVVLDGGSVVKDSLNEDAGCDRVLQEYLVRNR